MHSPALFRNSLFSRGNILVALASAASAVALVLPNAWALAPLALALLIYANWRASSRNDAFIQGFGFGAVTTAAGIWWVWNLLPFSELGYTNPWVGASAVGVIWVIESLVLAVPVGMMSALIWESRTSFAAPLIAGVLWPVAEWGRMWTFALFAYGPDSLLGPHYSIIALGYALAENAFTAGFAHFGGIYGLSLLAGLMGGGGASLCNMVLKREKKTGAGLLLAAAVLIILTTQIPNGRPNVPPLSFALVNAKEIDLSQGPTLESYLLSVAASVQNPDVIIFPEELSLTRGLSPDDVAALARKYFGGRETLVIVPTQEGGEGGAQRSVLASVSSTDGVVNLYRKQFLMPEVEYMPYFSRFIFSLIPDANVSSYLSSVRPLRRGYELNAFTFKNVGFGALLCSDSISPSLFRTLSEKGARILVDAGNQGWFNRSTLLAWRLTLIAKTHAIQDRAYFFSADAAIPAYAIGPDGNIVSGSTAGPDNRITTVSIPGR